MVRVVNPHLIPINSHIKPSYATVVSLPIIGIIPIPAIFCPYKSHKTIIKTMIKLLEIHNKEIIKPSQPTLHHCFQQRTPHKTGTPSHEGDGCGLLVPGWRPTLGGLSWHIENGENHLWRRRISWGYNYDMYAYLCVYIYINYVYIKRGY